MIEIAIAVSCESEALHKFLRTNIPRCCKRNDFRQIERLKSIAQRFSSGSGRQAASPKFASEPPTNFGAGREMSGEVRAMQSGEAGYVRFRLTDAGLKEGGRRFADEFADLTKPGHYECGDPSCECRRTGNPADCIHQH